MMRRCVSFCLVLLLLASLSVPAFAHDKEEHDRILEKVLFGNPSFLDSLTAGSKAYKALDAMEDAVAICLDQYQGMYGELLTELHAYKIHGLPENIQAIDFPGNQYHRRYTHRGWNFNYATSDLGHWAIRKDLLCQTVNYAFGFQKRAGRWSFLGKEKDYSYSTKCDAFAAFIYYVHVLGDYTASGKGTVHGSVIPLAREHYKDANNEDFFFELEKYLPLVLERAAAENDAAYWGLMQDIRSMHELGVSYEKDGGVTDESFPKYQELAKQLLTKLEAKMPVLLQKEPYFADLFYK